MKGSLIIIAFFVLGIVCGHQHLLPDSLNVADLSFYALCALMFFVGISVGCDPKTMLSFRQLNPRFALLPLMTIGGTLAGCLVVSLLLPHRSAADCCAIGSGFGYYSLSSILINEVRGAELGTIALASNIIRELVTVAFAPLMVKWFKNFAPISSGGATTADTTLPVIQRFSGNQYVPLSVLHGAVMDFSVPVFLTLFFSLM